MGTIAILREAHKGGKTKNNQISTEGHIYNKQEKSNADPNLNKNYGKENTLIYFDGDKLIKEKFVRDGNNQYLIDKFKEKEQKIDAEAREDYKQHKLKEREANPQKKVRTVLQTKNLKREFGLFLGGKKEIGNKDEFEKKILSTVKKIMEKKGLEDKNIISIAIHYDEKTPHCHIQYNDYSFQHHTTGAELQRVRTDKNASKEVKAYAYKEQMNKFSKFQDIAAEGMEMERGQKNSKQKHKTKFEFYEEKAKTKEVKNTFAVFEAENRIKNLITKMSEKNKNISDLNDELEKLKSEVSELKAKSDELSELFEAMGLDEVKHCKSENVKKIITSKENDWMKYSFENAKAVLIDENNKMIEIAKKQMQEINEANKKALEETYKIEQQYNKQVINIRSHIKDDRDIG